MFEKAAEQGVVPAMSFIGQCYDFGKGVPCNMEKAVYWFSKAAEQGDAVTQYNLASCHENGNCVEQDVDKAVYWYTKAAEQGIDVEEELERLASND